MTYSSRPQLSRLDQTDIVAYPIYNTEPIFAFVSILIQLYLYNVSKLIINVNEERIYRAVIHITVSIVHHEHGNRRQRKLRRQNCSMEVKMEPSSTNLAGKLDCREYLTVISLWPNAELANKSTGNCSIV